MAWSQVQATPRWKLLAALGRQPRDGYRQVRASPPVRQAGGWRQVRSAPRDGYRRVQQPRNSSRWNAVLEMLGRAGPVQAPPPVIPNYAQDLTHIMGVPRGMENVGGVDPWIASQLPQQDLSHIMGVPADSSELDAYLANALAAAAARRNSRYME